MPVRTRARTHKRTNARTQSNSEGPTATVTITSAAVGLPTWVSHRTASAEESGVYERNIVSPHGGTVLTVSASGLNAFVKVTLAGFIPRWRLSLQCPLPALFATRRTAHACLRTRRCVLYNTHSVVGPALQEFVLWDGHLVTCEFSGDDGKNHSVRSPFCPLPPP